MAASACVSPFGLFMSLMRSFEPADGLCAVPLRQVASQSR